MKQTQIVQRELCVEHVTTLLCSINNFSLTHKLLLHAINAVAGVVIKPKAIEFLLDAQAPLPSVNVVRLVFRPLDGESNRFVGCNPVVARRVPGHHLNATDERQFLKQLGVASTQLGE